MTAPPWLLWGQKKTGSILRAPPKGQTDFVDVQLAQVNYARPDTWRMLAFAQVLKSTTVGTGQTDFSVLFNALVGVGQHALTIPLGFFRFSGNNGIADGASKCCTCFEGPARDDTEAAGNPNNICWLPAQLLVISANVTFSNPQADTTLDFAVGFFVAPNVHVRPEWYAVNAQPTEELIPQFPGGEHKGL